MLKIFSGGSSVMVKDKAWSPYAAGIVIGLLQIPAFLIIGSALGASSSYVSVSAYIAGLIDPAIKEIGYFEKYMTSLSFTDMEDSDRRGTGSASGYGLHRWFYPSFWCPLGGRLYPGSWYFRSGSVGSIFHGCSGEYVSGRYGCSKHHAAFVGGMYGIYICCYGYSNGADFRLCHRKKPCF